MSRVLYPDQPHDDSPTTITLDQLDAAIAFAVVRIRRMANDARSRIGLERYDYPIDQWPIVQTINKEEETS